MAARKKKPKPRNTKWRGGDLGTRVPRRFDLDRGHVLRGPEVVCSTCGNKRCPKATAHWQDCTGSNEPGQPGSYYGPEASWPLEDKREWT